jgi:hypothetical protein
MLVPFQTHSYTVGSVKRQRKKTYKLLKKRLRKGWLCIQRPENTIPRDPGYPEYKNRELLHQKEAQRNEK